MNLRWPLLFAGAATVAGLHVRASKKVAPREPSVAAAQRPRAIAVRIEPRAEEDRIEIEIRYADSAGPDAEVRLPFGAGSIHDVELRDGAGNQRAIKADGFRDRSRLAFPLPPDRTAVVSFATAPFARDKPTFGWGYRAVGSDWVANVTDARVPVTVEIAVPEGTTAPGFRCSTGAVMRVCSVTIRSRNTLGLPIAPHSDSGFRLAFATAIGAVISILMYAIYRRWSDLAYAMGARDEDLAKGPVTLDELAVEVRKAHARKRVDPGPPEPEVDPLEAVALVARGITSVLSVIGSMFLVSHFYGGLFPIPAPLALALFALVGGGIVIVATGIDRARPLLALALVIVVAAIALHPLARWVAPGLLPITAGVLMQLTAKR